MSVFQFLFPTSGEFDFVKYVLLILVLLCGYWYLSVPRGLPPGPLGIPVLGYLPFITRNPYVQFDQIAKKYGTIFSFYLGKQLAIVLNDFDSIHEAFIRKGAIFSGRPKLPGSDVATSKFQNVVSSDGHHWKEQRHFALSTLRDLGLGKTSIEPKIINEIHHFCDELHKVKGEATNFQHLLGLSMANNVCLMLFGKRFEYHDAFLIDRYQESLTVITNENQVGASNFFPWILNVPILNRLFDDRRKIRDAIGRNTETFMTVLNQKYKKSHVHGSRDTYIDAYLTEAQRRKENGITDSIFNDSALCQNLRVIFGAGSDTTTNTLTWGIVYLLNYPEVQLKIHQEIDAQIGSDRSPSWSDRVRTPYTEATMWEIMRLSSIVPLSVVHRTTKDVHVKGYFIPKDSYILPNLWSVHHDSKLWKDPQNFRPERFLTETGEVVKPEYLIPFSIGKRRCLGESLAIVEFYLYFATLLQQFELKMAPNESVPSMNAKPEAQFILQPNNFRVSFKIRHQN